MLFLPVMQWRPHQPSSHTGSLPVGRNRSDSTGLLLGRTNDRRHSRRCVCTGMDTTADLRCWSGVFCEKCLWCFVSALWQNWVQGALVAGGGGGGVLGVKSRREFVPFKVIFLKVNTALWLGSSDLLLGNTSKLPKQTYRSLSWQVAMCSCYLA